MYPTHSLQVGARTVNYLAEGPENGPRVILLHGGGFDNASLSWSKLIPELAEHYRVLAPNWPGVGGSTAFGRPYAVRDLGEWLKAFLDALGVEKASFAGVSMGGGAALWMAANHAGRVEALIPVATHGVTPTVPYHFLSYLLMRLPVNAVTFAVLRRSRRALRGMMKSIFADPARLTPQIVDEAVEAIADAGAAQAFTHFQRGESTPTGVRTDFTARLPEMKQRTLFIHGTKDPLIPIASVERAAAAMPNARLQVLNAGHWPMREVPKEFNECVLDFLAEE